MMLLNPPANNCRLSSKALLLQFAPGGPMTTVSGHHRLPSAISLVIRGRGTAQPGTPGAVILDASTGTPAETPGHLAGAATCSATLVAIGASPLPPPASDHQAAGPRTSSMI